MIPSPEVKKLSLKDYREIVTKRWWIVLVALVISFLYVKAVLLSAPDLYQASVRFTLVSKAQGPAFLTRLTSQAMAQNVSKQLQRPIPADELLGMAGVTGTTKEGVTTFGVTSKDPKLAAVIANLWIDSFVADALVKQKSSMEAEAKAVAQDAERLEDPIKAAARSMVDSEIALSSYEETKKAEAERDRQIQVLADKIKALEKGRQDLSAKYTPDHPRMVYMGREIEEVKLEMEAKKKSLKGLSKEDTEKYLLLKKEAETQRRNYDALVQKMQILRDRAAQLKLEQESFATAKDFTGSLQVIDRAQVPKKPMPRTKNAAQYFLIGLLIGVALCFALEYLDSTLKIPEEVEFYARMPFLGYIPAFGTLGAKRRELDLFCAAQPESPASEAFHNAKVALLFASDESKPLKTILVASAEHREGRTVIASNLAIVFAAAGEKTLLIDGDLRKGKLGASYGIEHQYGFTDLIKGIATADQVVQATQIPNLSLITAGFIFPNIIDLLSSPAFKRVMDDLKTRFDRIVIDALPVLGTFDDLLMTRVSDGILFVISTGKTRLEQIQESKKKLAVSTTPIIGAVLNRAKIEKNLFYFATHFPRVWGKKAPKAAPAGLTQKVFGKIPQSLNIFKRPH